MLFFFCWETGNGSRANGIFPSSYGIFTRYILQVFPLLLKSKLLKNWKKSLILSKRLCHSWMHFCNWMAEKNHYCYKLNGQKILIDRTVTSSTFFVFIFSDFFEINNVSHSLVTVIIYKEIHQFVYLPPSPPTPQKRNKGKWNINFMFESYLRLG